MPMTDAETVKPDVSSTTVSTKPATPASPPTAAVQQLTTGPAGERGTEDDARHPPELLFHGPIVLRLIHASRRASAQPPAASATTAYTHSTANPRPGDRVCDCGLTAVSEFSAISMGMNWPTEFWIE